MAGALSDLVKLWEGYAESHDQKTSSQTIEYRVPWDRRDAARSVLLGAASSDFSWLTCDKVDVKPFGNPDTTAGGPEDARVTALFVPVTSASAPISNDYSDWREQWVGGGEAITVGEGYRWSDNALLASCTAIRKEDASAVKLFPTATITLTGMASTAVISDGKTTILGLLGKVNQNTLTLKGYTYEAEHLLFLEAPLEEVSNTTGGRRYNVTFKWAYRKEAGWNEYWRRDKSGGPGFQRIVATGGSPYQLGHMSNLDPKYWYSDMGV